MSGRFEKKQFWCCEVGFDVIFFLTKPEESGRFCELDDAGAAAQTMRASENQLLREVVLCGARRNPFWRQQVQWSM